MTEARQIVRARLREHAASSFPVDVRAIGIRAAPTLIACFDIVAEIEVIGHGLTPVIERIDALRTGHLKTELDRVLSSHLSRADMLAHSRSIGARGLIEVLALQAIAWAKMDPRFALSHLERRNMLYFEYWTNDGSARAMLRWREGLLRADIVHYGNPIGLIGGVLQVQRLLPAKTLERRRGRPIGKLVRDIHLPEETRVISATRGGGMTMLVLKHPLGTAARLGTPVVVITGRSARRSPMRPSVM